MFKLVQKAKKNQKGFTLVELMVVVVIIGVLVSIAIPVFNNVQQNARINAHNANVRILQGAATQMMAENAPLTDAVTWPAVDAAPTGWTNYLAEWPENPLTTVSYSVYITRTGDINVTPPAQ